MAVSLLSVTSRSSTVSCRRHDLSQSGNKEHAQAGEICVSSKTVSHFSISADVFVEMKKVRLRHTHERSRSTNDPTVVNILGEICSKF